MIVNKFTAAYLDNVFIHSSTWTDHLLHLWEVLSELWHALLTDNPCKCQLGLQEVQYLCYHIGQGLLRPQEVKIGYMLLPMTHYKNTWYVPSWGWLGIVSDLYLTYLF